MNELSDLTVKISNDVGKEFLLSGEQLFSNVRDRFLEFSRETMYTIRQFEESVRESVNALQIVSAEVEKFKNNVNEIIRNIGNRNLESRDVESREIENSYFKSGDVEYGKVNNRDIGKDLFGNKDLVGNKNLAGNRDLVGNRDLENKNAENRNAGDTKAEDWNSGNRNLEIRNTGNRNIEAASIKNINIEKRNIDNRIDNRTIENSDAILIYNSGTISEDTGLDIVDLMSGLMKKAEFLDKKATDLESNSKELWNKANKFMEVFIRQKNQFYTVVNNMNKKLPDVAKEVNKMNEQLNRIYKNSFSILESLENNDRIIKNIKTLLNDSVEKMTLFLPQNIKYRKNLSYKTEAESEEYFNIADSKITDIKDLSMLNLKDLSTIKMKNYTEEFSNQEKKVRKKLILLYIIYILAFAILCVLLLNKS
ncbi:MAG TPA: hypothetical protein GXX20_08670 [Clostridiaceae bacterium]|nr:hypothetical protein [Clostridiaceae bacterium]